MPKVRYGILHRLKTWFQLIWLLFKRKVLRRKLFPKGQPKVLIVGPTGITPAAAFKPKIDVEPPPRTSRHERRSRRWRYSHLHRGFGFNMPKRQPCPKCQGQRRRQEKVDSQGLRGAYYYCTRDHLRYFVYA